VLLASLFEKIIILLLGLGSLLGALGAGLGAMLIAYNPFIGLAVIGAGMGLFALVSEPINRRAYPWRYQDPEA
jgi:hypothetical protein